MELTNARGHHAFARLKPAGNHHAFGAHLPHADLAVFQMQRIAFARYDPDVRLVARAVVRVKDCLNRYDQRLSVRAPGGWLN